MKTYNVAWVREEDVALANRKTLDDGFYAVEGMSGLVYHDRYTGLRVLSEFSRDLRTAHRVTKEDVSKIYDVLGVDNNSFELKDVDGFGTTGLPQLRVYENKIEIVDPETNEYLNPDNFGIFAPDFDITRPAKKTSTRNPFKGIMDQI